MFDQRPNRSGKLRPRWTTERKLSSKNDHTVFRIHSSNALPVLALTGFRFCCKTNGKPYILPPLRVPKYGLRGALWGAPLGPFWEPPGRSSGSYRSFSGDLFCSLLIPSGLSLWLLWELLCPSWRELRGASLRSNEEKRREQKRKEKKQRKESKARKNEIKTER